MLVLCRFRVPVEEQPTFTARARAAINVLSGRTGFVSADLGQNLDDPDLWTLVTRWQNVGSYRRALQGYEAKIAVVPLLSDCLDEPTAYEDPDVVGDPAVEPRPGSGCSSLSP